MDKKARPRKILPSKIFLGLGFDPQNDPFWALMNSKELKNPRALQTLQNFRFRKFCEISEGKFQKVEDQKQKVEDFLRTVRTSGAPSGARREGRRPAYELFQSI